MTSPDVCILKTDGINCDEEMAYAFESVGGKPEIVHVNQLRSGERKLANYGALAIPGGFSYGDDIKSGAVLATELTSYLSEQLQTFADDEKPIIGVCNGFQVLVRTGLLPWNNLGEQSVTLTDNETGRFECRWVNLAIGDSVCRFLEPEDISYGGQPIPMQVAHGEGRFLANKQSIDYLKRQGQVVLRYANQDGYSTADFPDNPNGSLDNIAAICDPEGLVLGMMPHPERSITAFHPDRARTEAARVAGTAIFYNIVDYIKREL